MHPQQPGPPGQTFFRKGTKVHGIEDGPMPIDEAEQSVKAVAREIAPKL
ncbi:hypothetical protein [Saccharopolyspora spinosa]